MANIVCLCGLLVSLQTRSNDRDGRPRARDGGRAGEAGNEETAALFLTMLYQGLEVLSLVGVW